MTGDIVLLRVLSDLVACGSLFQIGIEKKATRNLLKSAKSLSEM